MLFHHHHHQSFSRGSLTLLLCFTAPLWSVEFVLCLVHRTVIILFWILKNLFVLELVFSASFSLPYNSSLHFLLCLYTIKTKY